MPELCTNSTSPTGCGHYTVTVGGRTLYLYTAELSALSAIEKDQLFILAIRHKGVALAQLLNRVVFGDEATNVKIYNFLGPGLAITKTNIGTSYVNVCPGLNGERQVVDFTGCTEYRLMMHANLVGTGQFGARMVRDSDTSILHESSNLGAAGERELDTDWQSLPSAFQAQGLTYLRVQAKSTTATDDPVFRSIQLGVR